ncbi:MAG: hypothetical protein GTN81_06630 [Proteobacteria bacterium]|nr:hypothetical protein [Pseudomonadota bacterium]
MNGTTGRDGVFKLTILAILILSIVIQIAVSVWFYEKLKNMEDRLSLYPVNKPVEVDLRVTVPELVEIDRKIDKLHQRLGVPVTSRRTPTVDKQRSAEENSTKSKKKKLKPRQSTQVDVVEKIDN